MRQQRGLFWENLGNARPDYGVTGFLLLQPYIPEVMSVGPLMAFIPAKINRKFSYKMIMNYVIFLFFLSFYLFLFHLSKFQGIIIYQ